MMSVPSYDEKQKNAVRVTCPGCGKTYDATDGRIPEWKCEPCRHPTASVPLLSEDATIYARCPKCKGTDIKGPIVTPTGQRVYPPLYATKAWFCRTCWWDTSSKFRDDIAEKSAR